MATTEMIVDENALATLPGADAVALTVRNEVVEAFTPFVAEAGDVAREAAGVTVTDATQLTEMKKSRALRLKLRGIRGEVEKARKATKDKYLRPGQYVDEVCRHIVSLIEPVEKRLDDQEKFAERKEAERKAAIRSARVALLAPFGIDTTFYQLDEMTEPVFAQLLDSTRIAHESKLAAAAKAEADRLAAIEAQKAEDARVRAENERLRQEAVAAEQAAKAERDRVAAEQRAAEAKAAAERKAIEDKAAAERATHEVVVRKEREAREQLERDAEAARKKEADRVAAEAAAAKKAAAAPDKQKLKSIAQAVRSLDMPTVKSPEAIAALRIITNLLNTTADAIDDEADSL